MLIEDKDIQGVFRGFTKGTRSFKAEMVIRYSESLNNRPIYGQFILVQLENNNEAVLGRITGFSAEQFVKEQMSGSNSQRSKQDREKNLRYIINMRALGVVREQEGVIGFIASQRRLPHIGNPVAFPSARVLRALSNHDAKGVELGFLGYGEYIYAGNDTRLKHETWMQVMEDAVIPRFDVEQLVSRRTYVFARAGFGKSNLIKLLASELYKLKPVVTKINGKKSPVGMLLCDPQGEYYWPDDKGRPGLCDVPGLEKQLVVFTDKGAAAPSAYYRSFVAGGIKLDVRKLSPGDVMALALPAARQETQNVVKIKALKHEDWGKLVDLAYQNGNHADLTEFNFALGLKDSQEMEALAARANIVRAVRMLHDPKSDFLARLFASLAAGKLCVLDISNIRGAAALALTGLLLKLILAHNMSQFTVANSQSIPVIAVLEEAQSVLGKRDAVGNEIYEEWVKQGRKYDLGCILVTQQPSAIPTELLSQGDSWFLFHLLAESDLRAAGASNAHFSSDILNSLLHEPIPGQGVYWSSVSGLAYPLPVRIMSFETCYQQADPKYNRGAIETAVNQIGRLASKWRKKYSTVIDTEDGLPEQSDAGTEVSPAVTEPLAQKTLPVEIKIDENAIAEKSLQDSATTTQTLDRKHIQDDVLMKITADTTLMNRVIKHGIPWRGLTEEITKHLPAEAKDVMSAHDMVPVILDQVFGEGAWVTEKRASKSVPGKKTTWVISKEPVETV